MVPASPLLFSITLEKLVDLADAIVETTQAGKSAHVNATLAILVDLNKLMIKFKKLSKKVTLTL